MTNTSPLLPTVDECATSLVAQGLDRPTAEHAATVVLEHVRNHQRRYAAERKRASRRNRARAA